MSEGVYRSKPRGSATLRDRLIAAAPVVLDGATGTELEHRGVPTPLPLWSAQALDTHPELIRRIHAEYVEAGAEFITANTFRTQRRALARGGWGARAGSLTTQAVALAKDAIAGHEHRAWALGSAPPLEDCYRPDLVPDRPALEREHAEHMQHLATAGVAAVWVETMNTIREARVATEAAVAQGLDPLVSFVCDASARLLSGEPLAEAARVARDCGAVALGVNCVPASTLAPCLDVLGREALPIAAYPNLGAPCEDQGFARSADLAPNAFAQLALDAIEAGACLVGGCCGTTPDHIRAIAQRLDARPE